jgi:hypothetical protein
VQNYTPPPAKSNPKPLSAGGDVLTGTRKTNFLHFEAKLYAYFFDNLPDDGNLHPAILVRGSQNGTPAINRCNSGPLRTAPKEPGNRYGRFSPCGTNFQNRIKNVLYTLFIMLYE